jgi:hypothetical protein
MCFWDARKAVILELDRRPLSNVEALAVTKRSLDVGSMR